MQISNQTKAKKVVIQKPFDDKKSSVPDWLKDATSSQKNHSDLARTAKVNETGKPNLLKALKLEKYEKVANMSLPQPGIQKPPEPQKNETKKTT